MNRNRKEQRAAEKLLYTVIFSYIKEWLWSMQYDR